MILVWTSESSSSLAFIPTGGSPCRIGKSPKVASARGTFLEKNFWLSRMIFGDQFGGWVHNPDPRSLDIEFKFSLSARSLVPRLGIWEIEEKGNSALDCEETKGQIVCFDRY